MDTDSQSTSLQGLAYFKNKFTCCTQTVSYSQVYKMLETVEKQGRKKIVQILYVCSLKGSVFL